MPNLPLNRSARNAGLLRGCPLTRARLALTLCVSTVQAFFDRVNQDRLMARLKSRCPDADLLRLVNRFLKAGVSVDGQVVPTHLGVPQGGPLSPVLANVVLDELDWELDRRGHRFARYADDCNILVKSKRAGERVMASVTRYVSDTLRLTVNPLKSAVDRPMNRKFLGFTVSRNGTKLKVADKAIEKLKDRVRELTRTSGGVGGRGREASSYPDSAPSSQSCCR